MYESMTYEVILNRMMERVKTDYPNLDYREGSMIFNALASAAVEMTIMYAELDDTRNETFVQTATREYILMGCRDMGMDVSRFEATNSIHLGKFDVEVSLGSRWNHDLYNYEVVEYVGSSAGSNGRTIYSYRMRCETPGTSPNTITGDLTPIDATPNNLTYAVITECLIEGENESSDEEIRAAYYDYIDSTTSDGNVGQYKQWCSEYDGIGKYKIFPLWKGDNTVKVSILSASNGVASQDLITQFQEYLDPGIEGMGNGVAPIGAFVTVSTATEVPLDISGTITMKKGYSNTDSVDTAIRNYLESIAYTKNQVAYMTLGAAILAVEGVESINNLLVKDGMVDIALGNEEIPVLGVTNWTVINNG